MSLLQSSCWCPSLHYSNFTSLKSDLNSVYDEIQDLGYYRNKFPNCILERKVRNSKLGRRPKFKITAQNGSTTLLGLYGNDNEDEQQQEH